MFNFNLSAILMRFPAIIIALTIHEFSHGYISYRLGDRTAKNDGRLTLNPMKHIDPVGMLFLLIAGFGWAKPVMVNPYNLENPKHDMAFISAAGPVSNFITAFIIMLVYYPLAMSFHIRGNIFFEFIRILITINIALGIFNMLPVPPLDGSKVFGVILPDHMYFRFTGFRYGFILLIILIYTGFTSRIIQSVMSAVFAGYVFLVDKIYFFL